MNTFFKRFLGVSFIIAAIFGIAFSVISVYGVWRVRAAALTTLDDTVELISAPLDTTADGLVVMNQSLQAAADTIAATEEATLAIAQTMHDIDYVVSGFMNILSFIPGVHTVEDSDIDSASENLSSAEKEMLAVATNISAISSNLGDAQEVIDAYQDTVVTSQERLRNIQENGPKWITAMAVILTVIFIWLAIAQVGLIVQGMEMMHSEK
ncbi:MAG: hypothetical protein ABIG63_17755 [Chloroflexota bacterium]